MNKFNRWLRSKTGIATIIGIVVLLLVVAVAGQQLGWWGGGGLSGTAGIPAPTYDAPPDGFTCLPSCEENDPRLFILAGADQRSLSNAPIVVWIMVPGDQSSFTFSIFDGDSSKDKNNQIRLDKKGQFLIGYGHWDDAKTGDTTYTLYADPTAAGKGKAVVGTWMGNDAMPNNDWWSTTVNTSDVAPNNARGPNGHFYYRLEASRPDGSRGGNGFKVKSSGYLMAGVDPKYTIGLVAQFASDNDGKVIYPDYKWSKDPGTRSYYDGVWQFRFYVPDKDNKFIELWNGDFDRGTNTSNENKDTDDPNSEGVPYFAHGTNLAVNPEGEAGMGFPADDNNASPAHKVSPTVRIKLVDPNNLPIYEDLDPSGTEEWEVFSVGTDPSINSDKPATSLSEGEYKIQIEGMDLHNAFWLAVNYPICDPKGCPDVNSEGGCPRTIGYWKNNFKKVLAGSKAQETRESLEWGLNNIALESKIFRAGLVSSDLSQISPADHSDGGNNTTPLTLEQAAKILARDNSKGGKNYFSNLDSQSMMARALQQNLATWMNWGTGKLGKHTVLKLEGISGGTFEGTAWEALKEAEELILSGQNLERAKDIADVINNLEKNLDPANAIACTEYGKIIPPGKQPKTHKDMPKADKEDRPKEVPVPPSEPICSVPESSMTGEYAIIALNPAACQGEQNGLLFHGTSLTELDGTAYSAGCLRSVGTTDVYSTAPIDYVGELAGNSTDFDNLHGGIQKIDSPLPESAWSQPEPNCSDPAAIQMDGKDFKGEMFLGEGLYCISGDVTINANDTLMAEGATVYMQDGKFTINGGATVQWSAPGADASPAVPSVFLYVPQSNPSPVKINGNSDSYFSGILYAPASEVEVLGTGYVFGYQAQFVGWDVRVGGTADVILDWRANGQGVCK